MQGNRSSVSQTAEILLQITEALMFLHTLHYLHCRCPLSRYIDIYYIIRKFTFCSVHFVNKNSLEKEKKKNMILSLSSYLLSTIYCSLSSHAIMLVSASPPVAKLSSLQHMTGPGPGTAVGR